MTLVENIGEDLFIGIDGGGSKCKAVISNEKGKIIGQGLGGAANPFYGVEKALASILEASENAIKDAQLNEASVSLLTAGIGLAGVNLPRLFEQLNQWEHPFGEMYLTTDMDIANIGAHAGQPGAVIIVGTGSCGFVNSQGNKKMYGGHGFPIGDKGSGAWMGLKAIEHTLLVNDGFEAKDLLAKKIAEYFNVDSGILLSEKLVGKASQEYAKVASLVFECANSGDTKAQEIISQGASYIEKLSEKLLESKPDRLCMIGGLSKYILPQLKPEIAHYFSETKEQPEIGALHFAIQNWQAAKRNASLEKHQPNH